MVAAPVEDRAGRRQVLRVPEEDVDVMLDDFRLSVFGEVRFWPARVSLLAVQAHQQLRKLPRLGPRCRHDRKPYRSRALRATVRYWTNFVQLRTGEPVTPYNP